MMDLEAMKADFLARGGAVTRCEAGATAHNLTDRQWAAAVRSDVKVGDAEAEREWRRERAWHRAHDAFFVGDAEEGHRILDEESV